jgi:hypothetical protein
LRPDAATEVIKDFLRVHRSVWTANADFQSTGIFISIWRLES